PKQAGDLGQSRGLARHNREAHGGVGLIDVAVGLDARVVLADAGAGPEACRAVVAGAGVDLGEFDHAMTADEWALRPSLPPDQPAPRLPRGYSRNRPECSATGCVLWINPIGEA